MKPSSLNLLVVIALLMGTLILFKWSDQRPPESLAQPLEAIPRDLGGWVVDGNLPLTQAVLQVLLPTSYLSRDYGKNNQHLGLFVAYYAEQRAGETMHSPRNCLPGGGWEIWKHERVNVRSGGRDFLINKYSVQNADRRLIVFYWYQSRERIVADEYLGKLFLVRDAVMSGSTSGAFIRVTVLDDPDLARQAIQFSAQLIPQLESCFGRRRSLPGA